MHFAFHKDHSASLDYVSITNFNLVNSSGTGVQNRKSTTLIFQNRHDIDNISIVVILDYGNHFSLSQYVKKVSNKLK